MKKIKVAIIGAGMMGRYHAQALRRIPEVEVVALADPSLELAKQLCEEMGIPHVYGDYLEMLNAETVEVVHNCTPNHLHYPINLELINRGIHVYCEKPLALNSQESEELARLAEEKGVIAGVNFNYRQNAMVREMNQRIKMSNPGNLSEDWERTFLIHGHYIQDWMQFEADFNWRCLSEYGGVSRTVADIGSHWFDTVQYITEKKIVRVNAKLVNVMPQRRQYTKPVSPEELRTSKDFNYVDIDTEDMAFVTFEMEDGVMGSAVFSQVSGGRKNELVINVDGSHYAMTWNQEMPDKLLIRNRLDGTTVKHAGPDTLHGDAKRYATLPCGHPVGWLDALSNGIREYYATVLHGAAPNFPTFKDGDNIVKIVEACVKSSEEDRWVTVAE
jgi:predicted dehydrogenase